MRIALAFLAIATLQAQTPAFRPLHVSPVGIIVDDSGKPVLLRGVNRSATGSGNADATATDQDYAAQNQLLSINLVRIFVNAAWWSGNVQVPIANTTYQTYIDGLIQRAKKYGNYVLMVAQDPTGNYTDSAFTFWAAFAKKYAADPAVLYDTWEDMNGIDSGTWSDDQNQLIAAIRTYNPQALIFVEDIPTAFESIVAGKLTDLTWSNIVWNFHLYAGPASSCTEPSSPRYANWPKNFDPLAISFKRIRKILEKAGPRESWAQPAVRTELFREGAERKLHTAAHRAAREAEQHKRAGRYKEALQGIAGLRPEVDEFFDHVMVMAEESEVRRNRLTLLAELLSEFSTIADFSELAPAEK